MSEDAYIAACNSAKTLDEMRAVTATLGELGRTLNRILETVEVIAEELRNRR